MPSVGTQTTWSWLQEAKGYTGGDGPSSTVRPASDDREGGSENVQKERDGQPGTESGQVYGGHPQPTEEDGSSHPGPEDGSQLQRSEDLLHQCSLTETGASVDSSSSQELITKSSSQVGLQPLGTHTTLPQEVLRQLNEIQFPSDSEPSSEEEGGADEGEANDQPELIIPDLSSDQLPQPAILQYLRESESLACQYFSLDNMKEVAGRRAGKGRSPDSHGNTVGSRGRRTGEDVDSLLPQGGTVCDFCGQMRPIHNPYSYSGESSNESSPFCCAEHQELCLLAAAYMRQVLQARLQQGPRRITIDPSKRKAFKKTVEERALAMMRRKRKWEELRKKKLKQLQSSSFYSLAKQTKTIQFSLLSPPMGQARWLVQTESSTQGSHTHLNKRRRREERERVRRKTKGELEHWRDTGLLPSELVKRLQQSASPLRSLDLRVYGNGQPFVSLLPDGTGQCRYASGRLALVVFAPYPGALGYLVFEDHEHSRMLACVDELGKAVCYNPNGSMRLLFNTSQGTLYDDRGHMKITWSWKSHTHSPMFQPLSFPLNKHFQFRCSAQDNIMLTFSAPPQFIKFSIGCKVSKDMLAALKTPKDKRLQQLQSQLRETQATISHLFQAIQYNRKLSQIQSVYAPYGTPDRRVGNHGNSHKRTKSTGALSLYDSHKVTALRPLP